MCAKDDLIRRKSLLLTSTQTRLAGELATAESVTAKDSNHVNTFSLDFTFSFITISIRLLIARGNNILSLIAFIISYRLFADKLNIQQSLLDRVIVVLIIILRSTPSTLLAEFIPITKIRNPLLKKNAAKSRILLACADRRTKQCYLTICAILKYYNFNIYVSLATDTLHLLLKGLLIAVVSLLFILKAPFALHFIHAVCDLYALTHIIQDIRMYEALDSICTRANSEAHYITIVKQFYSITNKKEYILQICLYNSQRTALLAANYATIVKQSRLSTTLILGIQPYSIKLPLSEVAVNIAISNFIYAAAQSSSKRHNDPKHCNKEVLYLILTIIDYTCYDKDRKHIAYIRAFSEVLLFNNNRQIDNTTRMLSVPFKFYNLSTIIRSVHLVLRDLPNLITHEYNRLYLLTFDINLLRTLREYRRKQTRNN
ncbi:hypothetical protein HBI79_142010 [Parastagonospora nodorum]|nr:hypothetical protein HBI79_142010 [Parastagonospora nodorum]